MKKELVIFDLDGTLLNTIGDLAEAANYMLALRKLPEHDYATYCSYVGNGIMRLVERALPELWRTPERIAEARTDFLTYYYNHINRYTRPYAGVCMLLEKLQQQGVRLAVASNKFQAGTEKLINDFFPDIHFEAIFGQRPDVPLKPDPAVVEEILSLTGVARDRVLYVGDSGVDIQTAHRAGVRAIGVSWGFRSREELQEAAADRIIDQADELLDEVI